MKTISIIGIVGIPAKYGGFETLVENLVQDNNSVKFRVYCSRNSYRERKTHFKSAELVFIPIRANGWQSIFYDIL